MYFYSINDEYIDGDVQKLIEALLGTCMSLSHDGLSDEQEKVLFEEIFCCDACGWWSENYEKNDYNGENYCDECYNDEVDIASGEI